MKRLGAHQVNMSGTAFPVNALFEGLLFLRTDLGVIYRRTASTWTTVGIETGTSLPVVDLVAGRQFFLTTTNILYTYSGSAWVDSGSDSGTFEWDANRVTGVSNAGYTTVTFNSPFAEYPILAVQGESAGGLQFLVRNITKTSFDIKSDSGVSHAIHYIAVTPGWWLVNGVMIGAVEHTVVTSGTFHQSIDFPRGFKRTPAFGGSLLCSGTVDPGVGTIEIGGFSSLQTPVTADLNCGTKSLYLSQTTNTQAGRGIILIEPTGAAVNSNNMTSGGTGAFKVGHKFEAGVLRDAATGSGTVTFSGAFSSAPAVVGLINRGFDSGIVSSGPHRITLAAAPTTTVFTYVDTTTPCGVHWIAMDKGFNSTTARRL